MKVENLKLDVSNLELSGDVRSRIRNVIERIQMEAPSDSTVKFALRKGAGTLLGVIKVTSQAGIFLAECQGSCPTDLVEKLRVKMSRELMQWKGQRFLES